MAGRRGGIEKLFFFLRLGIEKLMAECSAHALSAVRPTVNGPYRASLENSMPPFFSFSFFVKLYGLLNGAIETKDRIAVTW
jgi:hypothetical protein